jgi:diketogulonate reductase-like aldo/keto reductase
VVADDVGHPILLAGGARVPRLALGVFQAGAGAGTRQAVLAALRVGYRHLDTAAIYRNEAEVGDAIRESGVPRDEIFVTTKLWNDDHGYDSTIRACERSLAELKLSYVDLYLVHWPVPGARRFTWRAMETLLKSGRCRAIGVSNYMPRHLDELLDGAVVPPAINQIELHPFLQQRGVVERCKALGIAVAAYSPLTKGRRLADPRLLEIARRIGRSPAQILLRWSVQKGYVVVAKSADRARIEENWDAWRVELAAATMAELDALEDGSRTAWDPTDVP